MERTTVAGIGAGICVVIWGITFVVSKGLMDFLSPLQLMSLRFAIALVALWLMYPKWEFDVRKEWIFILIALFGNFLYFYTENLALTKTYSSNVSILASTTSLMSLVLAHIIFKDRINSKQAGGFVLGLIGIVLVAFNGTVILHLNPKGDVLALSSALCWATYGVLLRKFGSGYDAFLITRKMMFYGLLITLPFVFVEGHAFDPSLLLEPGSIFGLLFLGLLGSCLCFALWNKSVKILGVVKSNIFLYAMPSVSLVAGFIAFDEIITPIAILGTVLVIVGMLIANRYSG